MQRFIRYVPNTLTILRLVAVPFFIRLMLEDHLTGAMWLFLAAEATDALDGFIARKYDVITTFGRIADPAADKMIQLAALFLLAVKGFIPLIIPCLFLLKELVLLIAGIFAIRSQMDTSARWYGKVASAAVFATIMLTFFLRDSLLPTILLWACVAFTLFALVMYGRNYLAHRREHGKPATRG